MSVKVHRSVFIAKSASIMGDVEIGEDSSIWYGAVLRGDGAPIRIGKGTSIQDNCVIHVDIGAPTTIGSGVTVGHCALVHGATVEDDCIIGMNAVVLNHARIGRGSIVGANALVTANKEIPPNSLVLGSPAKVVKTDAAMLEAIKENARIYIELARRHAKGEFPIYKV
jgi:carbonic anhydrase/acetyltransferase-like protein (isoleucine patch superfamily)